MAEAVSTDLVREFVIAGHGDLAKVKSMLAQRPTLLRAAYEWAPNDHESAIQAAAHVGSGRVVTYLLEQGAPLEIWTAAMLGRRRELEQMLAADPTLITAKGAHGIPLLPHAAFSGDPDLVRFLYEHGATKGVSAALANAVGQGHTEVVRWLLDHASPDLAWKNFQGKTALMLAEERGHGEIAKLLRQRGAVST